jgi:hypothetical protein
MQHPQIKHPNCTAKTAGQACAAGVRATGITRLAYVSTGDSRVFVFHPDAPDAYSLVQGIGTHPGAKTMGYDPKTRNLIEPGSDNGAMDVLVFSAKP